MKTISGSEKKAFGIEEWKLKYLWLPVLIVVGMFVSWAVVVQPRFDDISQFRADSVKIRKNVADLDQKRNYLQSINENDLVQKDQLLSQALPNHKDVYYLLTVVQQIAQNYNYVVDSFAVSPGVVGVGTTKLTPVVSGKADPLTRIPLDISLIGARSSYLDLIDAIEHALPILSIDSFKMASTQDTVKLDLSVTTYLSTTTLAVAVENLTLADLTLTKDDLATLNTLDGFHKLQNSGIGVSGNGQGFTNYGRIDPFN